MTNHSEGAERVDAAVAALGLSVDIVERGDARTLEEAAANVGVAPSQVIKTLVLKKSDDTYVFALVPGGRALSWPKVRALLGVNKVQLPRPEQALAATGFERGTIVPLGSTTAWPVIADITISGRVALGAGRPGHSLLTDAEPLLAALDATVADISDPE
ncbi:aminoacyl-tRNA deacylase [Microcella sp.]|uniref:aminoacyl-tRNA deacylase n=1 Tax=Microcella sp. TaxID=1913979 RepID=UPI00391CA7D1